MKLSSVLRNMGALQKIAMASTFLNLILAVGVVYLAIAYSSEKERLVIIPPHLEQKAVVAWEAANAEYYKSFGLYVAMMVANLQPRTASTIIESVSTFFDPKIYSEFRLQALAIVDDPVLKQSGTLVSFQPTSISFEVETRRVFVTGHLITKSNATQQQKTVTYEIGLVMREGRPWVEHFTSYEGTQLRTSQWHMNKAEGKAANMPLHAIPKRALQGNEDGDEKLQ